MAAISEGLESNQWDYGIEVEAATKNDLNAYAKAKPREYLDCNAVDSDLWDLYIEDFKGFTLNNFDNLKTSTKQTLRNHLRNRGVYVPQHHKNKTLSQALYETLQEQEQHSVVDSLN
ncbi:hypothetical protein B0O99DRAFT_601163 [Bisporella sp. PMI_857]|nr:hypothetical protein B0O99DRAFT_601163 [Bisporella sp. PMI_857]